MLFWMCCFTGFLLFIPSHTSACLPHSEEGSETATREKESVGQSKGQLHLQLKQEQPDGSQTLTDNELRVQLGLMALISVST